MHCTAVLRFCEHGQHCRVPVVAVNDVRLKAKVWYRIEHGARKESVLLALGLTAAIDLVAEVKLAVNKIDAHAVKLKALYAAVLGAPTEVYIKIEHVLDLRSVLILYAAVIRSDDPCVKAELFKRLRQRSDNVGKSARF